ncbi:MAG: radical SAM protein [Chloroflexota bacterium]
MIKVYTFRERPSYRKTFLGSPGILFKKISNYRQNKREYKEHRLQLKSLPIYLNVDVNNVCQLKCPLCPNGAGYNHRTKGKMNFADYKRLLDEIGDYIIRAYMFTWGEPLLNDDIYEMVAYAKKKLIFTNFSSNLNYLSSPERLVSSGLDTLKLSIDGVTEETYRKYRIGGDFKQVMENLRLIIEARKKQRKRTPYITWQYLVFKHNIHEMPAAVARAKEMGCDAIQFIGGHSFMGLMPNSDVKDLVALAGDYLVARDSEFSIYNSRDELKHPAEQCSWLWQSGSVNYNGSVSPCSGVWPENYDFGNCFTSSFREVWNNGKYREAREFVRRAANHEPINAGDSANICALCAGRRNYVDGVARSRGPAVFVREPAK